MKIAAGMLKWFFVAIGACSFALWLAGYPGSPFESLTLYFRYPERYARLEASRLRFLRDDCASKIAELKRRVMEDPASKARLVPDPKQPRLFHIPRSVIPAGLPYRDFITEEYQEAATSVAALAYDSSGMPESIFIAVAREGLFIPLSPLARPPDFVAALKVSETPRAFSVSFTP